MAGMFTRTSRVCWGRREIEAVVIATPHPTHADLAIRSLQAGKHVLVEKPMATSLADAVRIEEAAARSRRVFMALPFDRSPAVEEAKRLIELGAIGRVSMADAVLAHRGPTHAPWFFDARKAHWGVVADLGVYLISQLTYLFGPALTVRGKVGTIFPERQDQHGNPVAVTVDDNAAAILELPEGILGTIRANWCSPSDHRNVICRPGFMERQASFSSIPRQSLIGSLSFRPSTKYRRGGG